MWAGLSDFFPKNKVWSGQHSNVTVATSADAALARGPALTSTVTSPVDSVHLPAGCKERQLASVEFFPQIPKRNPVMSKP